MKNPAKGAVLGGGGELLIVLTIGGLTLVVFIADFGRSALLLSFSLIFLINDSSLKQTSFKYNRPSHCTIFNIFTVETSIGQSVG